MKDYEQFNEFLLSQFARILALQIRVFSVAKEVKYMKQFSDDVKAFTVFLEIYIHLKRF